MWCFNLADTVEIRKKFEELKNDYSDRRTRDLLHVAKTGELNLQGYTKEELLLLHVVLHKEFSYTTPTISRKRLTEIHEIVIEKLGNYYCNCKIWINS